eukprot:12139100-Alexandrium_andersonii.AAC.1
MSASLVGSEMCIRDSPPGRITTALLYLICAWAAVGLARRAELAPPRRACLLYTSDAADDM